MRVEGLEIVTRGAASGERACDLCRRRGSALRECRVRWGSDGSRPIQGFWWDLCESCIQAVEKLPDLPADKKHAEAKWDEAVQSIRRNVSCSRP
jgi:hypothetical protein